MKKMLVALFVAVCSCAFAEMDWKWSPVQISLFPYSMYRLASPKTSIHGWALGFATQDQKEILGLGTNFVSTANRFCGLNLSASGIYRSVTGLSVSGFQFASETDGVLIGLFNFGTIRGKCGWNLQIGGFNSLASADTSYFMWGSVTEPERQYPVRPCNMQIGLFNTAERGFQLGFINVNRNGWVPWFPIVNWSKRGN